MNFFLKTGHAIKNSYVELVHKVTWPSRSELANSAVVVMIASVIIAMFIFVVDLAFEWVLEQLYRVIR